MMHRPYVNAEEAERWGRDAERILSVMIRLMLAAMVLLAFPFIYLFGDLFVGIPWMIGDKLVPTDQLMAVLSLSISAVGLILVIRELWSIWGWYVDPIRVLWYDLSTHQEFGALLAEAVRIDSKFDQLSGDPDNPSVEMARQWGRAVDLAHKQRSFIHEASRQREIPRDSWPMRHEPIMPPALAQVLHDADGEAHAPVSQLHDVSIRVPAQPPVTELPPLDDLTEDEGDDASVTELEDGEAGSSKPASYTMAGWGLDQLPPPEPSELPDATECPIRSPGSCDSDGE